MLSVKSLCFCFFAEGRVCYKYKEVVGNSLLAKGGCLLREEAGCEGREGTCL